MLKLAPNSAAVLSVSGWKARKEGDLDTAYRYCKKTLDINDNIAEINFFVGAVYRPIGLYQHAIKYFTRAVELDPFWLYNYAALATAYLYFGDLNKAQENYEKILEINPQGLNCPDSYVLTCILMDEVNKGEAFLSQLEKIRPDHPDINYIRALLSAARGNRDTALKLDKDLFIYALLGMKEEAIQYLEDRIDGIFSDPYLMLNNLSIFDKYRENPRFLKILESKKKRYEEYLRKYGDL